MVNYSLGDFLIKIKNAALARRTEVVVSYSKLNYETAKVLQKDKVLASVSKNDSNLSVKIAYVSKEPVLMGLKLISKPGKRVYVKASELKEFKGVATYLLSTPSGIMMSREAIKKNLGGELIASIE